MANVRNGNTFYVDAASSAGTATSFIDQKGIKVLGVLFTSAAAGDTLTIADYAAAGGAAGSTKMVVRNVNATDSKYLALNEDTQISFPNGIWITSISASCTACLILAGAGT